jgi:hypothetical protein
MHATHGARRIISLWLIWHANLKICEGILRPMRASRELLRAVQLASPRALGVTVQAVRRCEPLILRTVNDMDGMEFYPPRSIRSMDIYGVIGFG